MLKPFINPFISKSVASHEWLGYAQVSMCIIVACVCYLAVHDEVAYAAGEVFVLQLRVNVGDVLVHTAQLEHLAHVEVS